MSDTAVSDGRNPEEPQPSRGRKRERNVSEWKKNKAKMCRNAGQPFVSVTIGRLVAGRSVGPPCRDGCFTKLTMPVIEAVFSKFWGLGDYDKQTEYLQSLIRPVPVNRRRKLLDEGQPARSLILQYSIKYNNKEYKVCKAGFLSVFNIGEKRVRNVVKKMKATGIPESDRRGRHTRSTKKDDKVLPTLPPQPNHSCSLVDVQNILSETKKRKTVQASSSGQLSHNSHFITSGHESVKEEGWCRLEHPLLLATLLARHKLDRRNEQFTVKPIKTESITYHEEVGGAKKNAEEDEERKGSCFTQRRNLEAEAHPPFKPFDTSSAGEGLGEGDMEDHEQKVDIKQEIVIKDEEIFKEPVECMEQDGNMIVVDGDPLEIIQPSFQPTSDPLDIDTPSSLSKPSNIEPPHGTLPEQLLKNGCDQKKKSFKNLKEAVEYLYLVPDQEGATGIDITLEPPDDGAESDADVPREDVVDVGEENLSLLGTKLLAEVPHIEFTNRNSCIERCSLWTMPVVIPEDTQHSSLMESEEGTQLPKKKLKTTKCTYVWERCYIKDSNDAEVLVPEPHIPSVLNSWHDEGLTPVDIFKVFWNEQLMESIKTETNRYHRVKYGKELGVTVEELYQVFGIFLLSGYNTVPNRRLFWSKQADTRNLAVTQSGMGVSRFENIVRSLHFVDNSKKPVEDKLFKVRPLFEHFNKIFMDLAQPLPMSWAIDETMEPYFGHCGPKQFIRGKPVRFGYKFWCLCSSEGLLISFKLNEGKETGYEEGHKESGYEEGHTVGKSVVETLAKGVVPSGSNGYIDNVFTTLPLLESFRKANVNLTGTIQKDEVRDVPLSDMKKRERGYAEMLRDKEKNIGVCQWNDNSDVIVATNKADSVSLTMSKCKQWSRKKKKLVCLPQPVIIQKYNKVMRGVDLFDQFRGKYRVSFRKRAWYYPLFRFLLNSSVVNGWILYRKVSKVTELEFLRDIVNVLLKPSVRPGKVVSLKHPECVRYDRTDHNIVMGDTQRRCGVCKKNVRPKCTKCDVALHVQCWVQYHTKI